MGCGKNRVIYFLCFIIFILILSAYSNSLFVPFVLDDFHSFVKEPSVLSFSFSYEGFRDLTKTTFGFYRFLPMLTFALDLQWGSGSILAFHITNVIIHLLATLTLFFLLISLFTFLSENSSCLPRKWQTSTVLIAVFTAGLWALSPVQTNAVTYLVQRMTSIAALFYFASLGCYLRGRIIHLHGTLNIKATIWYFFAIVFAICSLLSKQISITLPVMVLLIEFIFVCDGSPVRFFRKYKGLIALIALLLLLVVFYKLTSGVLDRYAHRHFTMSERLLTELRVVSSYIFLLLFPLPQFLNFEHDPVISTSFFTPISTFTSLIFLSIIIIGAWRIRKQYPLITFCIYWFFVNLLLESSVVPLELKFEHRLYLPSAGFYLFCVLVFCKLGSVFMPDVYYDRNNKILFITLIIILLSCLSLLTYKRNMVWQDTITLYQDCLRKSPLKPRVHSNFAQALSKQGKYEEAIERSEKALSLGVSGYETYWVNVNNIIVALFHMGDIQSAIERGESFLKDAPLETQKNNYPTFIANLAKMCLQDKKYQRAFDLNMQGFKFASLNKNKKCWEPFLIRFESYILLTLEICKKENYSLNLGWGIDNSNNLSVYGKMVEICFVMDELELAAKYCEKIRHENPISSEYVDIRNKIDNLNRLNSAQIEKGTIKTKYFYHPFAGKFNLCMASAYGLMKIGFPNEFFINYFLELANDLRPDNVDVVLLRSWLFYKAKSFSDAIREIDEAIALDGEYAQLWINRGLYCLEVDRNKDALKAFEKGLELYPGYPKKKKLKTMIKVAEFRLSKIQGGVYE